MDASEEINKQRSFVEKINLVANVIGNNSRRSGASYITTQSMIAKEKAKELVKNHTIFQGDDGTLGEYWTDNLEAIRHASLTVNEIIKSLENINEIDETIYWINVKQELQELCAEL